jgi:phage terminase small subunit
MSLTPKQERFAQLVAEGVNLSDAYRQAYDATKTKPETVNREAKAVMDNPKISTRVNELREPIIQKTQITLEKHLNDLMMLRNMAVKDGKIAAAIAAEVARGKAAGVHVEKTHVTLDMPSLVVQYVKA